MTLVHRSILVRLRYQLDVADEFVFSPWTSAWVVTVLTEVVVLERAKAWVGGEKDFVCDLYKVDLNN